MITYLRRRYMSSSAEVKANNIITYESSAKLSETTSSKFSGLHTNAFNTTIISHTFKNGVGTIVFNDDVTSIGNYAFSGCSDLTSITCSATTAHTTISNTFQNVKTGGTLYVPIGSTGYNTWMGIENYYLGKYNWTKIEQ